jgi:hypothetical protein
MRKDLQEQITTKAGISFLNSKTEPLYTSAPDHRGAPSACASSFGTRWVGSCAITGLSSAQISLYSSLPNFSVRMFAP